MGREKIIAAIRRNKPAGTALPELPSASLPGSDLIAQFKKTLEQIGSRVFLLENLTAAEEQIMALFPGAGRMLATVPGLAIGDPATASQNDVHQLADLDVAIIPGHWGVIENGAIWTTEKDLGHRALAFIAQHLVIVLERHKILVTMHDAYRQIKINETGFGVFIAGPSKTADIEQSLVIGAHGARSLTVLVV